MVKSKKEQFEQEFKEYFLDICNVNLTINSSWKEIIIKAKEIYSKYFKKKFSYGEENTIIYCLKLMTEKVDKDYLDSLGKQKFEKRIKELWLSGKRQLMFHKDWLDTSRLNNILDIYRFKAGTYEFNRLMKTWIELGIYKYRDSLLVDSSYKEVWELLKDYPKSIWLKSDYFMNKVEYYVADALDYCTPPQSEVFEIFRKEVFKEIPITRPLINPPPRIITQEEINKEFREQLDKIKI